MCLLCFLETPVLTFALLPCYRRNVGWESWICPLLLEILWIAVSCLQGFTVCFWNTFSTIFCILTHLMLLVSFYTHWKTSKNLWFSDVFRGYRKWPVAWTGIIKTFYFLFRSWIKYVFRVLLKIYGGALFQKLFKTNRYLSGTPS